MYLFHHVIISDNLLLLVVDTSGRWTKEALEVFSFY